jgi:cysteine desulfurase/selenocysteine lyase
MTHEEARKQFPHTWSDMVYLNHAAVSPMSFRVRDAVDKYLTRRALKGIEPYPWAQKMALETKQMLGTLLHADPHQIAFVLNTSDGINVLASGLDWKAGDRVLLNGLEFPSNKYPFLNLQRRGVIIDIVAPKDYKITPEQIRAAIRPETKLVSISFVQFLTGARSDLHAIGAICKAHDILFCVDAIQGIPHSAIDVEAANIDFLASGSHKWLMAPEGTGFIYVGKRAQERIHQGNLGWTSVVDPFDFVPHQERLRPDAGRYENGTLNFIGIAGLHAALEFVFEFGIQEMERQVLDLSGYLIDRLSSRGLNVLTPKDEHEHSGIVTFEMENPDDVYERLKSKNIIISTREGKLRAAPHFYCNEEDVRKLYVELFA